MFRRNSRSLRHSFRWQLHSRIPVVHEVDGVEVTCARRKIRPSDTLPPGLLAFLTYVDIKTTPSVYYQVNVRFSDGRLAQTYYVVPVSKRGSHAVGGMSSLYEARSVSFERITVGTGDAKPGPWLYFKFKRNDGTVTHGFPIT